MSFSCPGNVSQGSGGCIAGNEHQLKPGLRRPFLGSRTGFWVPLLDDCKISQVLLGAKRQTTKICAGPLISPRQRPNSQTFHFTCILSSAAPEPKPVIPTTLASPKPKTLNATGPSTPHPHTANPHPQVKKPSTLNPPLSPHNPNAPCFIP